MSQRIQWTEQFVLNGGIDETHAPQQIVPEKWSSASNMEPMPDGVRRRLGSAAENSVALQNINLSHEGGIQRREMGDGVAEFVAQGFLVGGTALSLSRVSVRLRKTSGDSPTGNVDAAIYNDSGSALFEPTTVVSGLDFSTDFVGIDSATLPTTFEWTHFVADPAVTLGSGTRFHIVIRHSNAAAGANVDLEEVTSPSGYADGDVNFSTDGTTWTGVGAADLNFRIYDGVATLTMIADYRLSDASTSRHLVFAGGELYKNVSGTMTAVSVREAAAMTTAATVFPSWAVGQDRFFMTNNTEISKKFYVLSGTERWENEGIAPPTAVLTLTATAGTGLPDGTYNVDYYYRNNDIGVPSNRKDQGVASSANQVVLTGGQHIAVSVIPATAVRANDRVTHVRFELKEVGSSIFRFVKEVTIGTLTTTITSADLPTTVQGEYNHDIPPLHKVKAVAENRQFILDVDDAGTRRPTRLMFSSINGTTPFYESFGANNFRDFGQGDGDHGTAIFFMPPRTLIVGLKNSIYAIDARRPGTSDKVKISSQVGIAHHNAGNVTGSKLFFFSNSAENVGNYVWIPGMKEPQLLRGIDNTIKSLSTTRFEFASTATFAPGDDRFQFWTMLTTTKILVFDYNLKSWTVYDKPVGREGAVLGVVESGGIDAVYFGGDDGVEYKQDTGSTDAGTAYTGVLTTGALDYTFPHLIKRHRWIRYLVEVNAAGSISLSTARDFGDRGSITASLPHNVIGAATAMVWGTGVWGTATWATSTNTKRQVSLRGAAEVFQHTLSSGDPWYMKGIQYGWQPTGRN